MRALGFCVSVAHADYMAARFTAAGIAARSITGQTPREEREASLGQAAHRHAVDEAWTAIASNRSRRCLT